MINNDLEVIIIYKKKQPQFISSIVGKEYGNRLLYNDEICLQTVSRYC